MKILAVETSGLEASVALSDAGQLLSEHVLDTTGRRNARLLVPAVDELLKQFAIEPTYIDVVAVSIGPGSFTGLRVGTVFAKTFVWINDAKLVAIDTLQCVAQRALPADGQITVISDAQRGDVFVNSYCGDTIAEPGGTVRIEKLDAVLAALQVQSTHLLTGPGVKRFADRIPEWITQAAEDNLMPRASALLPVARRMVSSEQWADPDTLEPVYLRRSYAEEKKSDHP